MVDIGQEQGATPAGHDRLARLEAEIGTVRRTGGTVARERAITRLSALGMLAAIAVAIYAYVLSTGANGPLQQGDAITLGLLALTIGVVSAASWLRFSMGGMLRFWLARLVLESESKDR